MNIITTEISFDKITLTDYERGNGHGSYGSGGCKYEEVFNRMIKTWRFMGIRLITYVAEWEHVPTHVWASLGAMGYDASGWKSKWASCPNFYGTVLKYKHPLMFDRPDLSVY